MFRAGLESGQPHVLRRIGLYDGLLLGQDLLGNCVNMNGAPRIRTPSRRSGARSCHAPGGVAARGPPVGVLRSVAHRRAESRFWGVFIIAVHRAFVLGLGARHRGIVELSEGVIRCVTVFACYSSSLFCYLTQCEKQGVRTDLRPRTLHGAAHARLRPPTGPPAPRHSWVAHT